MKSGWRRCTGKQESWKELWRPEREMLWISTRIYRTKPMRTKKPIGKFLLFCTKGIFSSFVQKEISPLLYKRKLPLFCTKGNFSGGQKTVDTYI
jgi:hypothetical protein